MSKYTLMNDIRDKIWYFLNDSKTNELFSALVVKKYQQFDLYTNIFLVLATCSSVAAWAIWQTFPTVWALVIGISQVLTLIKPYFLFPKYIKVFNEKGIHWQHLTVELEKLWYDINFDQIDEIGASISYFEFKKKALTFNNVPDDIIFFKHTFELGAAEKYCNLYLSKI